MIPLFGELTEQQFPLPTAWGGDTERPAHIWGGTGVPQANTDPCPAGMENPERAGSAPKTNCAFWALSAWDCNKVFNNIQRIRTVWKSPSQPNSNLKAGRKQCNQWQSLCKAVCHLKHPDRKSNPTGPIFQRKLFIQGVTGEWLLHTNLTGFCHFHRILQKYWIPLMP